MNKAKYVLCAVFIISISFVCAPLKSIAKTIYDSEENNISHTVVNKPNDTIGVAQTNDEKLLTEFNCDPAMLIYRDSDIDPKMLIPGDDNIDPKIFLKELP